MSTIRLQNLVKKFGDFTALKTMDLDDRATASSWRCSGLRAAASRRP